MVVNGNTHLLPDSRLKNETLGSKMVDWKLADGSTIRTEVVQVFCGNCGKLYGWVPKDNCVFAFWLCGKCSEKWATLAGTMAVPDEDFAKKVQEEMETKFGHALTDTEIIYHAERHELGTALELLNRESPYPIPSKPGE